MKKNNNVIWTVIVVLVIIGTLPIVKLHQDYQTLACGPGKFYRRYKNVNFWFYLKSLFSGQINLKGLIIDDALISEDADGFVVKQGMGYVNSNDGRLY